VLESVSRVVSHVTTPEQRRDATVLRRLMAAHRDARELLEVGAYAPGSNPDVDAMVALAPHVDTFLRQAVDAAAPVEQSWRALSALVAASGRAA
jgi:flagellum-specific ATP synthase